MFETPETKGEQSGMGMWVGILVVVALVVGGIVFYMGRKGDSQNATPAATASSASSAATSGPADPVKDLRIVSKKMDKDSVGAAMWSVELRNLSQVYSYSNIQYETTYVSADSTLLGTNHGVIPSLSLDPGDSQSAQFREALPSGTVLYTLKIIGATSSK
jgi:hypothetical protein